MSFDPGREGRRRLLEALCLHVERRVQEGLPINLRGVHAPVLSRERLSMMISTALDRVVRDVLEEVRRSIPEGVAVVEAPPDYSGRKSTMSNGRSCSSCGQVYPVAIVTYRDGEVEQVECWLCAPEFRGGKR